MKAHKIVCIADKGYYFVIAFQFVLYFCAYLVVALFRIGIYSLLELCGCSLVSLNGLIEGNVKLKDHQDFSIHVLQMFLMLLLVLMDLKFEVMGANRKEKSWESR